MELPSSATAVPLLPVTEAQHFRFLFGVDVFVQGECSIAVLQRYDTRILASCKYHT